MKRQLRLTKKLIDSLPPCPPDAATREIEYSDAEVAGLRLVVNRLGRKGWLYRYSHAGSKRSMKLGDYPVVEIAEARLKAMEARAMLARGQDPQEARQQAQEAKAMTLTRFFEQEYLPHAQSLRSVRDVKGRWLHHLKPAFGDTPLTQLRTQDIQRFHERKKVELCAATANRLLAQLKRALNLAILWEMGGLERNPCRGVRMHTENNQRTRYLAGEELRRFMAALEREPNRTAANFFKFLLATGVRRNEGLTARFSAIDFAQGTWRLEQTKSGHARVVYLNAVALAVLHEQRQVSRWDWVFPRLGGNVDAHLGDPKKAFQRVLRDAGITGIVLHSLRHSYATLLARDFPLQVAAQALGHRGGGNAVTARYAHVQAGQLREAVSRVSAAMLEAAG